MRAIPQLVSAPLSPIPIVEHFRRSHPPPTTHHVSTVTRYEIALFHKQTLCISHFQLRPAQPPPSGAFANYALPMGLAFASPGAIPEILTNTRLPISI